MYKEYVDEITGTSKRYLLPKVVIQRDPAFGRFVYLQFFDIVSLKTVDGMVPGSVTVEVSDHDNGIGVHQYLLFKGQDFKCRLKPVSVSHGTMNYRLSSDEFYSIASSSGVKGRIEGTNRSIEFEISSSHGILQTMRSYYSEYIEPREKALRDRVEAGVHAKLEKEKEAKRLEKIKFNFYNRECPMCAETVKAKALLCKECGHKFEDGQQYRDRIKEWEDRAEPFGLDPWDEKAIWQKEYEQTPAGKAEKEKELEAEKNLLKEQQEAEELQKKREIDAEAEYQRALKQIERDESFQALKNFGCALIWVPILLVFLAALIFG